MSAACTIPKEKLSCKFCDTKNSHNTAACIKKQKADKEKKQGEDNGKKDSNPKPLTASQERRNASEEARKRNLSTMKSNSSPTRLHNSCVQVRTMGNHISGTHSDSDEED